MRFLKYAAAVSGLAVAVVIYTHDVSKTVTEEDARYIERIFSEQGADVARDQAPRSFDEEIEAIVEVQRAVLAHANEDKGIPQGLPREPASLYKLRYGLCYDRSRTIEKALMLLGYEARHVAVYGTDRTGSALVSLLTPQIDSHAVSEVKTSKGWLVVDSNARWISLDADGRPWSMAELQGAANGGAPPVVWSPRNAEPMSKILTRPFTYVIGLYSRHGRFYPPDTPIPDVNWRDLVANLGFAI